ncbi:zinc finger protein 677-like [Penaeus monodon]|uniref:zinc finger protein 677-like n=1 Tax=Penaeus monodon TaxID=6687 RepID=UPI0018A7C02F|nr:zinc finger protein 677-like [Penaeus monodon]
MLYTIIKTMMLARCEDLGSSEGISRKHMWRNISNSNSYPSGTKIHQCLYCSYTSTLKCNMLRHERTHTGEKPFPCPHCNFRCSQNSDLKKHIRIHTGEKPFACSLCPYRSSQLNIANELKFHRYLKNTKQWNLHIFTKPNFGMTPVQMKHVHVACITNYVLCNKLKSSNFFFI